MLNKRGQGLQVSSIILILLGVAVLVILILGFTMGWDKLMPWLSPGNNVDTIVNQCQVACATTSTYGYCTQVRILKAEDLPPVNGKKQISKTCKEISTEYPVYNIAACPSLC